VARRRPAAARALLALAVFALLTVVHTWPLARDPAHLSRNDNGDALLNTWAIAWVAHQLPRDPAHLFDANIFYPARYTLGYSEAMIVQGVAALPILAAGGSPVLAYNLVLMAGFAFTGWAFCLLVRQWTGSWSAAYVGGSLAAFNSHVLVRLPHLQTQWVGFVAVALFALDRVVRSGRVPDAVLLGVAYALQGLTSIYLLVFTSWALLFGALARAGEWLKRHPRRTLALLALAVAVAVGLMSPYLLGYYELHRLTGFERGVRDQYAGSWVDYLATGSRLHYALWSRPFFHRAYSASFPGITAAVLVVLALVRTDTRRDPRLRMCAWIAVGCAAVSVLPRAPFYPVLHRLIPLFRAVRVPAHLGQIVLLMIAVVAGFAVAGLDRRWTNRRTWPLVAVALCAAVNLEALRAPLQYTPFSEIPPVYGVLAQQAPPVVVVELPFFAPRKYSLNASYMLDSTRYWHPLLNGYSGFRPAAYTGTYEALRSFPDAGSLVALHARGVTHVVVHESEFVEEFGRPRFDAIATIGSLQEIAADGDTHVYRLR